MNVATVDMPRSGNRPAPGGESQTKNSWCSPQVVIDALLEFNEGRPVELDPCSNPQSIVNANVEWFGPAENGTDGLITPWLVPPGSLVFFNPPYDDKFLWMRKAHDEAKRLVAMDCHIIGLLPADTDTDWFQRYATQAARRCFWRGRMRFMGDREDPARFPNVLPYWGTAVGRFQGVFSKLGWTV